MVREANERLADRRREGYNSVYVGDVWLSINYCFVYSMPRALINSDQHRWDDDHIAESCAYQRVAKGSVCRVCSCGMIALGTCPGKRKACWRLEVKSNDQHFMWTKRANVTVG